jgi:hypothetical protein
MTDKPGNLRADAGAGGSLKPAGEPAQPTENDGTAQNAGIRQNKGNPHSGTQKSVNPQ